MLYGSYKSCTPHMFDILTDSDRCTSTGPSHRRLQFPYLQYGGKGKPPSYRDGRYCARATQVIRCSGSTCPPPTATPEFRSKKHGAPACFEFMITQMSIAPNQELRPRNSYGNLKPSAGTSVRSDCDAILYFGPVLMLVHIQITTLLVTWYRALSFPISPRLGQVKYCSSRLGI